MNKSQSKTNINYIQNSETGWGRRGSDGNEAFFGEFERSCAKLSTNFAFKQSILNELLNSCLQRVFENFKAKIFIKKPLKTGEKNFFF